MAAKPNMDFLKEGDCGLMDLDGFQSYREHNRKSKDNFKVKILLTHGNCILLYP